MTGTYLGEHGLGVIAEVGFECFGICRIQVLHYELGIVLVSLRDAYQVGHLSFILLCILLAFLGEVIQDLQEPYFAHLTYRKRSL